MKILKSVVFFLKNYSSTIPNIVQEESQNALNSKPKTYKKWKIHIIKVKNVLAWLKPKSEDACYQCSLR